LFVLFDWRVGKGGISFKPLSFLALDGLFDPPFLVFPMEVCVKILGLVLLGIGNENGLGLGFGGSGFV